jgi:hypothetical protein
MYQGREDQQVIRRNQATINQSTKQKIKQQLLHNPAKSVKESQPELGFTSDGTNRQQRQTNRTKQDS